MLNRQALEDAVYSAYPDLEMSDIERLPSEKLDYMLGVKQGRWKLPRAKKPAEDKTTWHKTSERFEVRNGSLIFNRGALSDNWTVGEANPKASARSGSGAQWCASGAPWILCNRCRTGCGSFCV
jgi:hypothetical protein